MGERALDLIDGRMISSLTDSRSPSHQLIVPSRGDVSSLFPTVSNNVLTK